jgi:hypothetical protein
MYVFVYDMHNIVDKYFSINILPSRGFHGFPASESITQALQVWTRMLYPRRRSRTSQIFLRALGILRTGSKRRLIDTPLNIYTKFHRDKPK